MQLTLKFYGTLCTTKEFAINGIDADCDDFGSQWDHSPDELCPYGCGDMRFVRKPYSAEAMEAYGINKTEYDEVCKRLEEGLSFGSCNLCD